jgi:hypothetical protein
LDRRRRRSGHCRDARVRVHQTGLDDRQRAAFSEFVDYHRRRAGDLSDRQSIGGYTLSGALKAGA